MAITFGSVLATDADTTNTSAYTTGSFTPEANACLIVGVCWTHTAAGNTPTISGGSLTWTTLQAQTNFNTIASPNQFLGFFQANVGGAPGSMTVTVDFASQTQTGCAIIVLSFLGVDTTTPVVQTKTNSSNSGTSISATLTNALATGSATVSVVATGATIAVTPRTNWTEPTGADISYSSPSVDLEMQYRLATSETTGSGGPSSGSPALAIVVMELGLLSTSLSTAQTLPAWQQQTSIPAFSQVWV